MCEFVIDSDQQWSQLQLPHLHLLLRCRAQDGLAYPWEQKETRWCPTISRPRPDDELWYAVTLLELLQQSHSQRIVRSAVVPKHLSIRYDPLPFWYSYSDANPLCWWANDEFLYLPGLSSQVHRSIASTSRPELLPILLVAINACLSRVSRFGLLQWYHGRSLSQL